MIETAAAPISGDPELVAGVHLSKVFKTSRSAFGKKSLVRAVDDASVYVAAGELVGVVGESGSGKTTLGRLLLRLLEPTQGRVYFDGRDITFHHERDLRSLRRQMQILFQDAASSLDARSNVESIIAEPLRIHHLPQTPQEQSRRVRELLALVQLPESLLARRPHELSSGQSQRVALARALALDPRFLVCDEPMAALDAREQASLIELMARLQQQRGCAYLFISHDARLVLSTSQRSYVMYAGRIVESGDTPTLQNGARHPYTRALLHAVPELDPQRRRLRLLLEGEPPSPFEPGEGCVFRGRCPRMVAGHCDRDTPALLPVDGSELHQVACFYPVD